VDFSNLQGLSVWNHVFEDKETPSNLIQNSRKHGLRCATTFQFKLRPKTLKKVRQNSPKKKLHFFDFFFILCRGYSRTGFARDSNGHFQNYQKWSRFHGNYQNRRTSIFWLMVLSTKIDSTCVQMFGVGWGTNADGCRWHDWGADVSNAEESCYQESFLLLFFTIRPHLDHANNQNSKYGWYKGFFLSFFLGLWRPNLITGLSGWRNTRLAKRFKTFVPAKIWLELGFENVRFFFSLARSSGKPVLWRERQRSTKTVVRVSERLKRRHACFAELPGLLL